MYLLFSCAEYIVRGHPFSYRRIKRGAERVAYGDVLCNHGDVILCAHVGGLPIYHKQSWERADIIVVMTKSKFDPQTKMIDRPALLVEHVRDYSR